ISSANWVDLHSRPRGSRRHVAWAAAIFGIVEPIWKRPPRIRIRSGPGASRVTSPSSDAASGWPPPAPGDAIAERATAPRIAVGAESLEVTVGGGGPTLAIPSVAGRPEAAAQNARICSEREDLRGVLEHFS